MNINPINCNQNFQARIKMNKPKLEILAQTAIGTSAAAVGAASIGEGVLSFNAVSGDNPYSVESIPKEVIDFHRSVLLNDNDGKGIPVQSTALPIAMPASAFFPSKAASNAYTNAFGQDNINATTAMPIDASKAVSANKFAQNSMLGTGYLGTTAASLYSGFYGDEVNNVMPESIKSNGNDLKKLEQLSLATGGLSVFVPAGVGSGVLSSQAYDTKSGHFVADTLSNNKNKKLPS